MRSWDAVRIQAAVRAGDLTNDRFYAGRVEVRAGSMLCSGGIDQMHIPDTIYMQRDCDGDLSTWCVDRVNESDVVYVRADKLGQLLRGQTAILDALRALKRGE